MIEVIPTDHGTFNVIGIADGMFVLQGNLTREQLEQLNERTTAALATPAPDTSPTTPREGVS